MLLTVSILQQHHGGGVFIGGVIGHKAGWLYTPCRYCRGGADIILLPEIPYDINAIALRHLRRGTGRARDFLYLQLQKVLFQRKMQHLARKNLKAKNKDNPYPSISYKIGKEIEERTGQEVRITVPGHTIAWRWAMPI